MNNNLSDLITGFLTYKKQNGYVYKTAEYHLKKYYDHVSVLFPAETIPSRESTSLFLDTYADTPGNLYNAAAALREFSRYLISIGYPSAYIIPSGKISMPTPVQPYLFTDDEMGSCLPEMQPLIHFAGSRH